jgi:hypothetical protein
LTTLRVVSGDESSRLDEQVAIINSKIRKSAESLWEAGRGLLAAREGRLWETRHNTFDDFLDAEIDMARATAYQVMRAAEHFTRDDFREVGWTVLDLVLRAPVSGRPDILEAARAGASQREVKERVRAAKSAVKPDVFERYPEATAEPITKEEKAKALGTLRDALETTPEEAGATPRRSSRKLRAAPVAEATPERPSIQKMRASLTTDTSFEADKPTYVLSSDGRGTFDYSTLDEAIEEIRSRMLCATNGYAMTITKEFRK